MACRSRVLALVAPIPILLSGLSISASAPLAVGGAADRDGFSIEASLLGIPITGTLESFQVSAADLVAASRLAGLERPSSLEPADGVLNWIGPLTGVPNDEHPVAPVFVPLGESFNRAQITEIDEFEAELGWSFLDVDRFVEWWSPPERFAVMTGSFGDELAAPGLHEAADGVMTAGAGEDYAPNPEDVTPARPLGRPLHMALQDGQLAVSLSVDSVRSWLNGVDAGTTLGDDDAATAVSGALDDADVVSALVVRSDFSVSGMPRPQSDRETDQLLEGTVSQSFDTVGIGWTADSDQPVVIVVYAFADEGSARSMAEPLRSVWAEGTSFISNTAFSERLMLDNVVADGRVVSVRLLPVDNVSAQLPMQMLFARDVPFIHG